MGGGELSDYLLKLQDICSKYAERGTILIMGDFNAHLNGATYIKPADGRSGLLTQFLVGNNLVSINTLPTCIGAMSTYVSYSGEQLSMIDHILLPVEKGDLVSVCEILVDNALNVSTHRPIYCNVKLPHGEQPVKPFPMVNQSVKWRGSKPNVIDNYRQDVEKQSEIDKLYVRSINTTQDIDTLYNDIRLVLLSSSKNHLPFRKEFKQFLKPYWDDTLKDLHKKMRDNRRIWILDNRPRGVLFESYRSYKQAKRVFRQYHRKCAENYLKSLNEEIDRAAEINCDYFWKLINRRKSNNSSNIGAEIVFNNKTCRDSEVICTEWGNFFGSLYSDTDNNNYDSNHYDYVTSQVTILKQHHFDNSDITPVQEQELDTAISVLSTGKASGEDKIDNEHLINSGPIFRKGLINLFNAMIKYSHIPLEMKTGTIITLFKGGNKRKDDPNSYRAITLTSAVLKLFEKLLYKRIVQSIDTPLNPLQGGFQKNMGCNMTSFILQESINYAKENNSKLYACFLDAQKAFDKVWHDGLFLKLYEMGLDFYLWKLIVSLHTELSSFVLFRGFKSKPFKIRRGTRQGGVLSPYMFLCYIDDLLNQLCDSGFGLVINGINLTCPSVADDMLLQSLTKNGLQMLINICVIYFKKWRLDYNILKCLVIVFNELMTAYNRSHRRWFLGNAELREGTEYTHLGILVNKDMKVKQNISDSASKIRKTFFGVFSCEYDGMELHPYILKRIYESIVIPRALYGCELWSNLCQNDILLLERSHRFCVKSMQNMDRRTITCVALRLLGASSLIFEIHKRKLTLFGQLCRLDTFYAAKRLFLYRLTSQYLFRNITYGFIYDIFQLLKDYDFEYVLTDFMNSGRFLSKYCWKRLVNSKLRSCAERDAMSQATNEGLHVFLAIQPEAKPSLFWEICKKHPNMISICKSAVRLISLWLNRFPERVCSACGSLTLNYTPHCLLWCNVNASHRHRMWNGIWRKFGVDLYIRLAGFDSETLLSVLFGNYGLIADLIDTEHKMQFYCFIARFLYILESVCSSRA